MFRQRIVHQVLERQSYVVIQHSQKIVGARLPTSAPRGWKITSLRESGQCCSPVFISMMIIVATNAVCVVKWHPNIGSS